VKIERPECIQFTLKMNVRDYECDLQGIVNNAVYQNYLEHARHKYLQSKGLDFAKLHECGHDLIITSCQIEYQKPLRSGDDFSIGLCIEKKGRLRFIFYQEIRRPNGELVLSGSFVGTCLNRGGRPGFPLHINALFELD